MSQNDQHEQQNDNQQIPNVELNVQTEIVKAKPAQKVYKCKKCGKEFTSRSAYNAHIWEHTKAEREKAKAEKEKKVETEVVKAKTEEKTKINVKEKVISVWEKAKWYVIGSVFVVIFFVLYWYWKKKKEKEEGKQ